jgi:hypothetical protein
VLAHHQAGTTDPVVDLRTHAGMIERPEPGRPNCGQGSGPRRLLTVMQPEVMPSLRGCTCLLCYTLHVCAELQANDTVSHVNKEDDRTRKDRLES